MGLRSTTAVVRVLFFLTALAGCGGAVSTANDADASDLAGCSKATPTSVTAIGDDGNVPRNVIDGNYGTRWSHEGAGSWIQFDLGQTRTLCQSKVAWYQGSSRSNAFQISLSTDGRSFSQVYSGKSSGRTNALEAYTISGTGRYVRVTVNGNTVNDWASITELRAYTSAAAVDAGTPPAHDAGTPVTPPGDAGTPPASGSEPTASNTGVPAGTQLTVVSGNYTVSTNGAVVSGLDIHGSLTVSASNVTVKNTRVRCIGISDWCVTAGGATFLMQDSEIGGGADGSTVTTAIGMWLGGGASGSAADHHLLRVHVHHTTDGLRTDGDATVESCFIHDLYFGNGAHADGSQSTGYAHMIFRGNHIIGGNNDALFFKREDGSAPLDDITVDGNWLEAMPKTDGQQTSYGLGLDNTATNVRVTNNHFGSGFEVSYASSGTKWTAWSNNTDEATGAVLPAP